MNELICKILLLNDFFAFNFAVLVFTSCYFTLCNGRRSESSSTSKSGASGSNKKSDDTRGKKKRKEKKKGRKEKLPKMKKHKKQKRKGGQESPRSAVEWTPPPQCERPIYPGYTAPLEPTEDTKTQYQIYGFADASDFV